MESRQQNECFSEDDTDSRSTDELCVPLFIVLSVTLLLLLTFVLHYHTIELLPPPTSLPVSSPKSASSSSLPWRLGLKLLNQAGRRNIFPFEKWPDRQVLRFNSTVHCHLSFWHRFWDWFRMRSSSPYCHSDNQSFQKHLSIWRREVFWWLVLLRPSISRDLVKCLPRETIKRELSHSFSVLTDVGTTTRGTATSTSNAITTSITTLINIQGLYLPKIIFRLTESHELHHKFVSYHSTVFSLLLRTLQWEQVEILSQKQFQVFTEHLSVTIPVILAILCLSISLTSYLWPAFFEVVSHVFIYLVMAITTVVCCYYTYVQGMEFYRHRYPSAPLAVYAWLEDCCNISLTSRDLHLFLCLACLLLTINCIHIFCRSCRFVPLVADIMELANYLNYSLIFSTVPWMFFLCWMRIITVFLFILFNIMLFSVYGSVDVLQFHEMQSLYSYYFFLKPFHITVWNAVLCWIYVFLFVWFQHFCAILMQMSAIRAVYERFHSHALGLEQPVPLQSSWIYVYTVCRYHLGSVTLSALFSTVTGLFLSVFLFQGNLSLPMIWLIINVGKCLEFVNHMIVITDMSFMHALIECLGLIYRFPMLIVFLLYMLLAIPVISMVFILLILPFLVKVVLQEMCAFDMEQDKDLIMGSLVVVHVVLLWLLKSYFTAFRLSAICVFISAAKHCNNVEQLEEFFVLSGDRMTVRDHQKTAFYEVETIGQEFMDQSDQVETKSWENN